jgi:hypothetical protein
MNEERLLRTRVVTTTWGFLLRPTSVRLGEKSGLPFTFKDAHDLDPGNEA